VEEIGLFPLGIVLLPTELAPLHIFEERYKELIGECIEHDAEFGLVYADEDGAREVGTRAKVVHVLERFDDGRLNVVVAGGERFRVEALTRGRSFITAEVQALEDEAAVPSPEDAERALTAFRRLAEAVEAEPQEPDATSPELSFELAARVELPTPPKQDLLELRNEPARLRLVAKLLEDARQLVLMQQRLAEQASQNGTRLG
jgi:Lon protease-like protein